MQFLESIIYFCIKCLFKRSIFYPIFILIRIILHPFSIVILKNLSPYL
ncbi:hypothetical protein BANRA_02866 [Acinetobacter baumannii]|nr:hypothetical protein BANRA_02866 [Acinetobacter baumannii]